MCIRLPIPDCWRLCPRETMRPTLLRRNKHVHVGQVAPRCEHYAECGGCSIQDMAYPVQLRLKEENARPRSALPCLPPPLPAAALHEGVLPHHMHSCAIHLARYL